MREYEIDGSQFSTVDELAALLSAILVDAGLLPEGSRIPLDVYCPLDDAPGGSTSSRPMRRPGLRGMPDSFVIRWKNSSMSRERLGYPAISIEQRERGLASLDKWDDSYWAASALERNRG